MGERILHKRLCECCATRDITASPLISYQETKMEFQVNNYSKYCDCHFRLLGLVLYGMISKNDCCRWPEFLRKKIYKYRSHTKKKKKKD